MSLPFVLEHIDLIAAAPEGVKRLRELILELAVRGKLVPQDPNDEPASELLRRIQAEKAKLVAEGRIRKDKPLPEVGEDERPFELPALWEWVRLGAVTTFGQTDKSGDIDDSAWVLDLEDIEKDTSVLLQKIRFADRPAKSDKNQFQAGDVLYGKLRPYLNKVIVADDGGVCTTEILPVRGYGSLIYARYLMHALKRPDFLAYVNAKSYGMKMPRLGTDDGRMALFPLPPLPEQPRIVAKVDELMDLCDRLEAQQADAASAHATLVKTLLDTLTQSQSAAEFTANWQRIAQHFDNLFTTEASLSALKQTVLQLAVMGKLVPQDPNDEPASELLKRIQAEKAKLVAEGNIKKDKPLPEIGEDEQTFELPYGWEWVRFGAITRVCSELVKPEDFMNSFQVAPDCIEKGTGKLMERRTVRESGVRGPNQRFCSGQLLYSKILSTLTVYAAQICTRWRLI
jgi:type I restriction enzyme S subunit